MPTVRQSPSGPPIPGGIDTSSDGVENQSLVPDAATLTTALNRLATRYSTVWKDDFCTGINTISGGASVLQVGFGDKNWTGFRNNVATSVGRPTNVGGGLNIGAYNLATNNSAAAIAALSTGVGVGPGNGLHLERLDSAYWRGMGTPTISAGAPSRFGFGSQMNLTATLGANGMYFEHVPATNSGNWRVLVRQAGVTTVTINTTVFSDGSTYQLLEFARNPSTGLMTFSIDGVVVGSAAASTLPNAYVAPIAQHCGTAGSVSASNAERFSMNYTRRRLSSAALIV